MSPDSDAVARECAGTRPQHEVEGVFGVDRQTADLGAVHGQWPRDVAGLLTIAVEAQGYQAGRGKSDGLPLENDGGLCGIAAGEDRCCGLLGTE